MTLSEDVFDFAQQSPALRTVFYPGHGFEFEQQLALTLAQLSWSLHPHFDKEIALTMSVEYGDTPAFDAQCCARLGAFRNFQNVFAFEGGNVELRAQRSLRK